MDFQYRNITVERQSYLYNDNLITSKTAFLYWDGPLCQSFWDRKCHELSGTRTLNICEHCRKSKQMVFISFSFIYLCIRAHANTRSLLACIYSGLFNYTWSIYVDMRLTTGSLFVELMVHHLLGTKLLSKFMLIYQQ